MPEFPDVEGFNACSRNALGEKIAQVVVSDARSSASQWALRLGGYALFWKICGAPSSAASSGTRSAIARGFRSPNSPEAGAFQHVRQDFALERAAKW
jgi:hypothetical protein